MLESIFGNDSTGVKFMLLQLPKIMILQYLKSRLERFEEGGVLVKKVRTRLNKMGKVISNSVC
jgi:hypothetical protein